MILLNFADHANDDGTDIFPSINKTTRKTSISKTNVKYIIRALERISLINKSHRFRDNNSQKSNIYSINVPLLIKHSLLNLDEDSDAYKLARESIISNYSAALNFVKESKKSQYDPSKSHNMTRLKSRNVTPKTEKCDPLEPSSLTTTEKRERKIDKNQLEDFLKMAVNYEKPRSIRAYKNKLKKSLLNVDDNHHDITYEWFLEWRDINVITEEKFLDVTGGVKMGSMKAA